MTGWTCYQWAGPLLAEMHRRGPRAALPPLAVQDWSTHPEAAALSCNTPTVAIGWLREQIDRWADRIRPRDPGRRDRLMGYLDARLVEPALQHLCSFGPCDVLCRITRHSRIVTFQYSTGGGEAVAWAIVPKDSVDLANGGVS